MNKSKKPTISLLDVFTRRYNDLLNRRDLADNELIVAVENNKKQYQKAQAIYQWSKKELKKVKDILKRSRPSDYEYYDNLAVRDNLQETVNSYDALIRQERIKQDEPMWKAFLDKEYPKIVSQESNVVTEESKKKFEKETKKKEIKNKRRQNKQEDYNRLDNLYSSYLKKFENVESSPLFTFKIPVAGTKYDIGTEGGQILIPILHIKSLNEMPMYIVKYAEQVISQIIENISGRFYFRFECYAQFAQIDNEGNMTELERQSVKDNTTLIDSPNQISELCGKAIQDIMNFFDNIVSQKSGLTFLHGLAFMIKYTKNEHGKFTKKNRGGPMSTIWKLYVAFLDKYVKKDIT